VWEGGMNKIETPRTHAAWESCVASGSTGSLISECSKLERELASAQIGAARYEYLRKLRLPEYTALIRDCAFQGLNFDAEVDRRRAAK